MNRHFLYIDNMITEINRYRFIPENFNKFFRTIDPDKSKFWNHVYSSLHKKWGDPELWAGSDPWEVAVGGVLAQNTSWTNVEKALENLHESGIDNPNRLLAIEGAKLAELVRPSGYYNQKAKKLVALAEWWIQSVDSQNLISLSDIELREELINIWGIGPETADYIANWAFGRPLFVVDAYTMRIQTRVLGLSKKMSYEQIQKEVHSQLPDNPLIYYYFHALLMVLAKLHCVARNPKCADCPLSDRCDYFLVKKKLLM